MRTQTMKQPSTADELCREYPDDSMVETSGWGCARNIGENLLHSCIEQGVWEYRPVIQPYSYHCYIPSKLSCRLSRDPYEMFMGRRE
jgi:hypothetical protein